MYCSSILNMRKKKIFTSEMNVYMDCYEYMTIVLEIRQRFIPTIWCMKHGNGVIFMLPNG